MRIPQRHSAPQGYPKDARSAEQIQEYLFYPTEEAIKQAHAVFYTIHFVEKQL